MADHCTVIQALVDQVPGVSQRPSPSHRARPRSYAADGYGFDQIVLSFFETEKRFERPLVVIGLMTLDLDRSILTVRDAPKPYYLFENRQLVLKGVPLPDPEVWYRDNPPTILSYFTSFTRRHLQRAAHRGRFLEEPYRTDDKIRINSALFKALAERLASRNVDAVVVLFYSRWEIRYVGWREQFVKDAAKELGLPLIDTKALLLVDDLSDPEAVISRYYRPDGHPGAEANQLVAEVIATQLAGLRPRLSSVLRQNWGEVPRPPRRPSGRASRPRHTPQYVEGAKRGQRGCIGGR